MTSDPALTTPRLALRSGSKSVRSGGHFPDFSPGAAAATRSDKEIRRGWLRAFGLAGKCFRCSESCPLRAGYSRRKTTDLAAELLAQSSAMGCGRASLAARTRSSEAELPFTAIRP